MSFCFFESNEISIGKFVKIINQKGKKIDLNGRLGRIIEFNINRSPPRWDLRLIGDGSVKSIRTQDLAVVVIPFFFILIFWLETSFSLHSHN